MADAASESQYQLFLNFINMTRAQAMIAKCLAVSGITLLIHDWLTNLDKEFQYAWARKWTLARVVYHLNRVFPILLIGGILIPMTSIIRCWVLYRERWVLWVLIPGLVATIGHATLRVTGIIEKAIIMTNLFPELFQGCLISIPNDMWLAYISGVFFELITFCLLVWKIWRLGKGIGLTPLMRQLLKNGISFFAVNLGLILFSCVGSAYPSTIILANGSGLLTALSSIMCSRIFFSMHDFAREDQVRVSLGPPLAAGALGGISISGQFAIQMDTFDDDTGSEPGLQVTVVTSQSWR